VKTLLSVLGFSVLTVCANATTCPNSGSWQTFIWSGFMHVARRPVFVLEFRPDIAGECYQRLSVGVLLTTTPGSEGFNFNPGFLVGSNMQDVSLFYSVQGVGVSFNSHSLNFNGSFTGTGTTLTAETYCLGSAVDLNTTACGGSQVAQVTNLPTNLQTAIVFGPATSLSMSDRIVANGGTNGTAGISSVNILLELPNPPPPYSWAGAFPRSVCCAAV
jgi:hypothetical protein